MSPVIHKGFLELRAWQKEPWAGSWQDLGFGPDFAAEWPCSNYLTLWSSVSFCVKYRNRIRLVGFQTFFFFRTKGNLVVTRVKQMPAEHLWIPRRTSSKVSSDLIHVLTLWKHFFSYLNVSFAPAFSALKRRTHLSLCGALQAFIGHEKALTLIHCPFPWEFIGQLAFSHLCRTRGNRI